MRVIAGSAGGIRLTVPETNLRPTMDRVKAAIFSSLGERVIGARVLDLFAGTGALGLEALSRGAASALFVDENRAAVQAIERNFQKTKLRGRVTKQEVFAFLNRQRSNETFDIIFADPPYEQAKGGGEFTRMLLENENLCDVLAPDGVFLLEKRPDEQLFEPALWTVARAKTYGATEVLFLEDANRPNE